MGLVGPMGLMGLVGLVGLMSLTGWQNWERAREASIETLFRLAAGRRSNAKSAKTETKEQRRKGGGSFEGCKFKEGQERKWRG